MEDIIIVLVALAVMIGIFLLLREFWCWYWKISHRLEKLSSIERELEEIIHLMRRQEDTMPSDRGNWNNHHEEAKRIHYREDKAAERRFDDHDEI